MPANEPVRRPRLRWWQALCRLAAVAMLLVACAYAMLPWWVPRDYLRRRLVEQLRGQTGLDVRIGSIALSWSEGVELRDVSFASPPGSPNAVHRVWGPFGAADMLRIRAVRTELSPIGLLLHHRLAWMELDQPEVRAVIDANGNSNLQPLQGLRADVEVDRVSIRDGRLAVKLAGDPRPVCLNVRTLQYEGGRIGHVGQITMSAWLAQGPDGNEAPVSLSPWASQESVAAAASFTFANVDLGQLPLPPLLGLPITRLAGRCSGSLDLKVNRQAVVEGFGMNVVIQRLDVESAGGHKLPVIDEAGIRASAAYDHLAHALQVESISLRLPGVELRGKAKVFTEVLAGRYEAIESLSLKGELDPTRLAVLLTGRGLLPGGLAVDGPVAVDVSARQEGQQLVFDLSADAAGADVRRGQGVLKPAGRPCRGQLHGAFDQRTDVLTIGSSQWVLGSNSFQGQGRFPGLRRAVERLEDAAERRGRPKGSPGRAPTAREILAELREFHWEGTGEFHEANSLRDLAPGLPAAWGRVELAGTVTGRWSIDRSDEIRLHVSVAAPPAAALRIPGAFAKPAGAPLSLVIDAAVDPNLAALNGLTVDLAVGSSHLRVERARLAWDSGGGVPKRDTPRLGAPSQPASRGAEDASLHAAGRFAAEGLETLLSCLPPGGAGAPALPGQTRGSLTGQFLLDLCADRRQIELTADLKDASLVIPQGFIKPAGREAELAVRFMADPRPGPASTGPARVEPLSEGTGAPDARWGLPGPAQGSPNATHRVWGPPDASPPAAAALAPRGFLLAVAWRCPQAQVEASCTSDTSGASPLKALGRPTSAAASGPAGAGQPGPTTGPAERADLALRADVGDVTWLVESFPAVGALLAGANVAGPLRIRATGQTQDGRLDANVLLDATQVAYRSDGPPLRVKPAGAPLCLRLACQLGIEDTLASGRGRPQEQGTSRVPVEVRFAELVLGDSRVVVTGQADVSPEAERPAARLWPPPYVASFQADARGRLTVDQALGGLVPEAARAASDHGLTGRLDFQTALRFDAEGVNLKTRLDATHLGAADLLPPVPPARAPWPRRPRADQAESTAEALRRSLAGLGPIAKPEELPTEIDLELTCPQDLSCGQVDSLRIRAGDLVVQADGSAPFQLGASGLPAGVGKVAAHLAVSAPRLESLPLLLPAAKPYQPSGGVFLETELYDVANGLVSYLTADLTDLRARWRGKEFSLSGSVLAEGISPGKDPQAAAGPAAGPKSRLPAIGRLKTDGLEFRLGENHLWLLADLSNLPGKPAGTFHLLGDYLDDQELTAWLLGEPEAGLREAGRPAAGAAAPWRLSRQQIEQLQEQARETVALGREYLAAASVEGRIAVRHLRTHDRSVDRHYDLRRLEATVSAEDGHLKVDLAGGINGGLRRDFYSVYLTDPGPMVACEVEMKDVLGEENIQPQLARFFPGNRVHGRFSRQERTRAPLVDLLAYAIDSRYPLHPMGTAKMLALDGTTEGRAAPAFVARIFPGLNLARYDYWRMTAFTEFQADGTAVNDMIFNGRTVDLYMEGATDAENVGRYEIGVILTPQSPEWNHTYRQGRVPILNFQARIEGGRMHDEQVSYLWPNETIFVIFLKNNIFYRIWQAASGAGEKG